MKRFMVVCSIIIIGFLVLEQPIVIFSEESDVNSDNKAEIDISLSPSDVLFQVDELKPGDWIERSITIKNDGKKDFNYYMSLRNDGDEKLFNEFLLEIHNADGKLYNGKLSEFDTLEMKELAAGKEEVLNIIVRFPEYLGNDFQGLNSQFSFIYTAEGTRDTDVQDEDSIDGSVGSGEDDPTNTGSLLPSTATNMFNFLLIGSIILGITVLLATINAIKKLKQKKHFT
ncbi:TasA family protein [Ornithinibacillus contaminans]|uniref:TasA family protein n=1 Tax=Ornithinibacillus contaminans TaxID=694055 RepID=UPI00064DE784|nr:TasA family protein [Ornithinibacillus contaminans]